MNKKSENLLLISLNFILQLVLLAISLDQFSALTETGNELFYLFQILANTVLGGVLLFLFNRLFNKIIKKARIKLIISICLLFVLNIPLYMKLAKKIRNEFTPEQVSLSTKIQPDTLFNNGYVVKNLTLNEYNYLSAKIGTGVKLPKTASNIDFSYHGDEFLGDYYQEIVYEVPANTQIKQFENTQPYFFSQNFTRKGKKLVVHYIERRN